MINLIGMEMPNYPTFEWILFGIIMGIISIFVFIFYIVYKRRIIEINSSLMVIFKRKLKEDKIKITIFTLISIIPGVIIFLIFTLMSTLMGGFDIIQVRIFISYIINFFLLYLGIAYTIAFTSTGIINAKRNGTLSWFLSKPIRRWEFLWGRILSYLFTSIMISVACSLSILIGGLLTFDPLYIEEILSIAGFIFLINILALLTLTAIGVFLSSVFRKTGLAIFIPIFMFMILPTIVGFLPIVVRSEWPLLFSFSYYFEELSSAWISQFGGGLSSIYLAYSELLGIDIFTLNLSAIHIVLILIILSISLFIISTLYLQKTDIP